MYKNTIITQFESVVCNYGNKIAIKDNESSISYESLQKSIDLLADCLYQKNESQYVYLLFPHVISMVIGMFSVLKSGKAYIPLDPKQPIERLGYILQDSDGYILLTNSKCINIANMLKELNDDIVIINIDDIQANSSNYLKENYDDPNGIAYILYTSGSTGKPKGVIQSNENVLYYIANYSKNLKITNDDNITLFSKYTFDASVMNIYSALLNGATLCIFDVENINLFVAFEEWVLRNQITVYHSVPTVFRHIIRRVKKCEYLETVRVVVLGGESVLINDFEEYKRVFSDKCIFVNGLGPTEATVALQYIANKNTQVDSTVVPVGYPIKGTDAYIVNDMQECVKVNEVGELVLSSKHLALGYNGRIDETNARFKMDLQEKRRFYFTGDLAKIDERGVFEFCGRKDLQIKINGIRIELNEIESVLDNYVKIEKSVVVPINRDGFKIIVAYYTLRNNNDGIEEAEIIDWIKNYLPSYMIPSAFRYVNILPKTATGKIDRKKLIDYYEMENSQAKVTENMDDIENKVFLIWKKLLHNTLFNLDTSFNNAGGDSLLLIELQLEIEETYDISIALVELNKLDTIRKLADYIRGKML